MGAGMAQGACCCREGPDTVCARREWANHRLHTVQLLEEGRQVAAAVRKAIVSTRQPAAQAKAARERRPRKSGLPGRC